MSRLRTLDAAVILRSLSIQGSWNYRTMIGGGFAFSILPLLRRLYGDDEDRLAEAVRRHSSHFNAHPYLASVALGATARLEEDGVDPELVDRFKVAVRGPLGGVGDSLVWVGLLPATALLGVSVALFGAGPLSALVTFLLLFNVGHLWLRVWGYKAGHEAGLRVGDRIREAGLPRLSGKLARVATLLLGIASGAVLSGGGSWDRLPWPWILLWGVGFALGVRRGTRSDRHWVNALLVLLVILFVAGVAR